MAKYRMWVEQEQMLIIRTGGRAQCKRFCLQENWKLIRRYDYKPSPFSFSCFYEE